MGGRQKDRTLFREIFGTEHGAITQIMQGDVLSEDHGQGGPERIDIRFKG